MQSLNDPAGIVLRYGPKFKDFNNPHPENVSAEILVISSSPLTVTSFSQPENVASSAGT